ncbi:hypothetical protein SBV1_1560033 [Verrucomicrobia bacterium]|nr:hypothetical protein SBV1_1560033 [Verrucomicrobiota bacterium]
MAQPVVKAPDGPANFASGRRGGDFGPPALLSDELLEGLEIVLHFSLDDLRNVTIFEDGFEFALLMP